MTTDQIPVVLHAHFYQPPRDNPWIESVDREPSAAPFHDWNERIESECYGANTHARVMGESGRISHIVNNYAHLNFNIGPTLLSWLETRAPTTYQAIIDADRASCELHDGHGGAIAQAYSHVILPLCNPRDRDTQILWGIADFKHRFGREPEAMWLPETACNIDTAVALARHGMKYIILSPHQAARCRSTHSASWLDWLDVSNGGIDPRKPYRLSLPEGRSIVCFFYDGPIAHAMSFEAVLDTSRGFAERLLSSADHNSGSNQLIHVATDGETFGHHKRFADRALAYFILREAEAHGLRLTTYGAHLERVSVEDEVEIKPGEGTAWSCAHGVGRWIRDCGCNSGGRPGFHQSWRGPLRTALDGLRDDAAIVLEDVGSELLADPWLARNDYIDVILRNTRDARDSFIEKHARKTLDSQQRVRLFETMEAHRLTQLMYASCGWFFDDLTGIETTQIMKYAGMAAKLLDSASGREHLPPFLDRLSQAWSNIESEGNGADVYRRHVIPCEVPIERRLARYASRTLSGAASRTKDPAFEIEPLDTAVFSQAAHKLVAGRVHIRRTRTERGGTYVYGASPMPELDMHCGVVASDRSDDFGSIVSKAQRLFEQPTTPGIIRFIDSEFGRDLFSVRELSAAGRAEFAEHMEAELVDRLEATYGFLYDEHRRTMVAFERAGVEAPRELRIIAEYTLARRLDAATLEAHDNTDPWLIRTATGIAVQARELGIKLVAPKSAARFREFLVEAACSLRLDPSVENAERAVELLSLTEVLRMPVSFDRLQDVVLELLGGSGLLWSEAFREWIAGRVGVVAVPVR